MAVFTTGNLGIFYRDCMAYKAENNYYIVLYGKSLLTPC